MPRAEADLGSLPLLWSQAMNNNPEDAVALAAPTSGSSGAAASCDDPPTPPRKQPSSLRPWVAALPQPTHGRCTLLAAVLLAAGVIGSAVQATFLYTPTAPPVPPALGIYLAALLGALSLEALWWHAPAPRRAWLHPLPQGRVPQRCRWWGAALADVTCVLLFVGFLVGYRLDGALWCLPLGLALLLLSLPPAGDAVSSSSALPGEAPAAPTVPSQQQPSDAIPISRYTCLPKAAPLRAHCCAAVHALLWGATLLLLVLLLGGCGTIAVGWRRYGPRGAFYDIPLAAGGVQRLHAWCSGPTRNASAPTIWLEVGGGGHSSSDTFGLQMALNDRGRRVCTHDQPGTGWSRLSTSLAPANLPNAELTAGLMAAMGEVGPFIMVGTMDDGPKRIYEYALVHPENVAALVPMQYGVDEFVTLQQYHGWPQQHTADVAAATLRARLSLSDLIRFLAVPWGLMQLLAPLDPSFVPAGMQAECRFLNLEHEGQWDMQARYLATQAASPSTTVLAPDTWAANRSLSPLISVLAIDNPSSDPCGTAGYPQASDDCLELLYSVQLTTEFMRNMTTMSEGSSLLTCAGGPSVCGGDWLGGGSTVPFVAGAILGAFGNVTTVPG